MEDEWFTSDSPICVAARTLDIHGGENELLEITLGPRKDKYRVCTRGGIKTSTLVDTSRVQKSFRIGHYGMGIFPIQYMMLVHFRLLRDDEKRFELHRPHFP